MAGVSIEVESAGLRRLEARLAALADFSSAAGARTSLLESVAAEIETQTHRRIRAGGPAPDGFSFGRTAVPWPEWSDDYALTRQGGQGLLFGEGDLDDTIQALVEGDHAPRFSFADQFGGVVSE